MKTLISGALALMLVAFGVSGVATANDAPGGASKSSDMQKSLPVTPKTEKQADSQKSQPANPNKDKTAKDAQKAEPSSDVKGAQAPDPVDPLHPPITLLLTDVQVRVIWTPYGWRYVAFPVRYYVVAVWNPRVQAYGYYDTYGVYRLYYPPVVPAPKPAPSPRPPKK